MLLTASLLQPYDKGEFRGVECRCSFVSPDVLSKK